MSWGLQPDSIIRKDLNFDSAPYSMTLSKYNFSTPHILPPLISEVAVKMNEC